MTSCAVPVRKMSINTPSVQRNDNPTEPQANRCAISWEYFLPASPFTIAASKGNTGMSFMSRSVTLPLQEVHLVHVRGDLSTEHDDDDGEPDCRFSGRNGNDEERHQLTRHGFQVIGKGDEVNVRRVQHDLD